MLVAGSAPASLSNNEIYPGASRASTPHLHHWSRALNHTQSTTAGPLPYLLCRTTTRSPCTVVCWYFSIQRTHLCAFLYFPSIPPPMAPPSPPCVDWPSVSLGTIEAFCTTPVLPLKYPMYYPRSTPVLLSIIPLHCPFSTPLHPV